MSLTSSIALLEMSMPFHFRLCFSAAMHAEFCPSLTVPFANRHQAFCVSVQPKYRLYLPNTDKLPQTTSTTAAEYSRTTCRPWVRLGTDSDNIAGCEAAREHRPAHDHNEDNENRLVTESWPWLLNRPQLFEIDPSTLEK